MSDFELKMVTYNVWTGVLLGITTLAYSLLAAHNIDSIMTPGNWYGLDRTEDIDFTSTRSITLFPLRAIDRSKSESRPSDLGV